jgi:L-threonylcarbamoyladenylate synthase
MTAKVRIVESDNPDIKMLEEAAYLLLKGEVIVCPTDTGYAFAANALDEAAIEKVFALKKRPHHKPIHMAVSTIDEAGRYAYVNEVARVLAQRFLPGALTLVLLRRETVPSLLTGGRDTVGIRIPDNQTILTLVHMVDCPLTTTSANLSGQATPYRVQEIISQLGNSIHEVSLILDQGAIPPLGTSTIVDLSVEPPQILRQGLISEPEIWEVLGSNKISKCP